ncbi:sensor histidine kinase [Pedobacter sp. Leaf176]|uniref:sensor histidine kinase n=1 Tax=Pedobacter sp. Leaf176 TaxID=1736286 RepID=UPI000701CBA8|nr:histidine kinase [Pedobacter sp. Leaf176]KQR71745.1 hypothetical protein ASF92_00015 [Pedobacter sp. Leaf176]
MIKLKKNIQWNYVQIELLFFFVFFYLFPVLTDIEYNFNEPRHASPLSESLKWTLIYGSFAILPALIFYYLIKVFLVRKRLMLFLLSACAYLVGLHFYMAGEYYLIGHASFLPVQMQKNALRWYAAGNIHFSVVYMFREFICIMALAFFIRSAKQDKKLHEMSEQQLISELNYLKAQLHPHFFFNTMNNIYSFALQKSEHTAPMVAKLADMMRYILYEAHHKKVPLQNEIAFIINYIETEKIRYKMAHKISFDVQGNASNVLIEPLLLLPFIENAFKHGLEDETGKGNVRLVLFINGREIILQVNNSKPIGYCKREKGIGLENVIKRLKLLYPERYKLEISDEPHEYQVNLTLMIE